MIKTNGKDVMNEKSKLSQRCMRFEAGTQKRPLSGLVDNIQLRPSVEVNIQKARGK